MNAWQVLGMLACLCGAAGWVVIACHSRTVARCREILRVNRHRNDHLRIVPRTVRWGDTE